MILLKRKRKRDEMVYESLKVENVKVAIGQKLVENSLLFLISHGIETLCARNNLQQQPCSGSDFDSCDKLNVSIFEYLRKIVMLIDNWAQQVEERDGPLESESNENQLSSGITHVFMALIYMDRVQRTGKIIVNKRSVHRVLLTSIMVAHKFLEDKRLSNGWFANVGGISKKEICVLEATLCFASDWRLLVSRQEFESMKIKCLKTFTMVVRSDKKRKSVNVQSQYAVKEKYADTFSQTISTSAPSVSAF
uniref:Cyclin n=1 Tax=Aplanochytrium stocchinoi TaxID=215587 RepID=A0A7S3V0F5_9STRA|mmetsp:Transcript_6711/g.8463  ORF Transcript_6711/g.8463 Transcript_6711/m.8463 type:complete len:250 (-) Transcript_6711:109-858(-)|eukprot:CAMPEP_0204860476 /NCGR_PEP_ID=MMETSP1348-20121228/421_1 /ASSEMBLY_ACC=CAM_ASM_000700 /TAXON_ID=215587 /ORGANISM="Aplanochytrium stocchinoi, Strain GSBS06" /LENGTH=249 /DNA_ID=CAMNT_0052009179 /DNA_START=206 /DNA_END=955 /DNA_ORIENTATION=-